MRYIRPFQKLLDKSMCFSTRWRACAGPSPIRVYMLVALRVSVIITHKHKSVNKEK